MPFIIQLIRAFLSLTHSGRGTLALDIAQAKALRSIPRSEPRPQHVAKTSLCSARSICTFRVFCMLRRYSQVWCESHTSPVVSPTKPTASVWLPYKLGCCSRGALTKREGCPQVRRSMPAFDATRAAWRSAKES
eukprot:1294506-Pleurochrysis_carterae.AAC.3